MCGICGIIKASDPISPKDRQTIESMKSSLAHRGPDGDGTLVGERFIKQAEKSMRLKETFRKEWR